MTPDPDPPAAVVGRHHFRWAERKDADWCADCHRTKDDPVHSTQVEVDRGIDTDELDRHAIGGLTQAEADRFTQAIAPGPPDLRQAIQAATEVVRGNVHLWNFQRRDLDECAANIARIAVEAAWMVLGGLTAVERSHLLTVEVERYRQHILDIDAHATPFGPDLVDEPGFNGSYLISAGALHRALGLIDQTAPSCNAEAELEAARSRVHCLEVEVRDLERRLAQADRNTADAQAQVTMLRQVIDDTAWIGTPTGGAYCHWCGGDRPTHFNDCPLDLRVAPGKDTGADDES